ncbi:hypothetical protein WICMUC_001894 [Wickerhamomyces mucosus]|uniref:P-type Cu(+) transporter n=1 Tax=Wickerhamomyces mucosus TaxID=1378264 RepID=A0A9P8PTH9_9ASCO|nr:hypothetical protein WICMUC_001894 [Wickerhamomyces mucosus]
MSQTILSVKGMTCGACSSAITLQLESNPEVTNANVSLLTEEAIVQHSNSITSDEIKEIVENCGFDAETLSYNNQHGSTILNSKDKLDIFNTRIKITGMTCGACTSSITNSITQLNGVLDFQVSLITEEANIKHNGEISKNQIVEAIEDCGFDAVILESNIANNNDNNNLNSELVETILSIKGMTCGACTSSIENSLKQLDEVESIKVSLITEQAIVKHLKSLDPQILKDSIDDCGFDSEIVEILTISHDEDQIESIVLQIENYDPQNLNALLGINGIKSFNFNNDSEINLIYNPYIIGIRDVIKFLHDQLNIKASAKELSLNTENLNKLDEIKMWLNNFIITGIIGLPMFVFDHVFMELDWEISHGLYIKSSIELMLTTFIQFTIGLRFYENAKNSLKHGSGTMDLLIFISTNISYYFSILTMIIRIIDNDLENNSPHTLFETSILLINFVSLGKYFETKAKSQTSFALSKLINLTSAHCSIIKTQSSTFSENDKIIQIPINLLQINDIAEIKPGEKIPADGIVIHGESEADESLLTGESIPIIKLKGDKVIGGSINGFGHLFIRVESTSQNSQLSKIIKAVKHAQLTKAPIQSYADKIAAIFVPSVLLLSLFTFLCWLVICNVFEDLPDIFMHGDKFFVCLKIAISVIVVACPCALGLAAPTAVMVGTGVAANNGILIKGGEVLQRSNDLDILLFDKTGTLTQGEMSVETYSFVNDMDERLIWKLVGKIESICEHPIGKAISKFVEIEKSVGFSDMEVISFEAKIGQGLFSVIKYEGLEYKVEIGNHKMFDSSRFLKIESLNTVAYISINNEYKGYLELQDKVKDDTIPIINLLKTKFDFQVGICTGDSKSVANNIAEKIGIPLGNTYAEISPYGKKELVEDLQKQGFRVGFIGDGINDSPALATADLGIALASTGTDIAMDAADIVIIKNELKGVSDAISISISTLNRIKWNFFWSSVYNLIMLPIAVGVLIPWGIQLNPLAAGLAMAFSSVSVVVSSLMLKRWKSPTFTAGESNRTKERMINVNDDVEMMQGLLRD